MLIIDGVAGYGWSESGCFVADTAFISHQYPEMRLLDVRYSETFLENSSNAGPDISHSYGSRNVQYFLCISLVEQKIYYKILESEQIKYVPLCH